MRHRRRDQPLITQPAERAKILHFVEITMAQATVGRWGKSLAIRVPHDVAKRIGLVDGERVEIDAQDRDIVIRRPAAQARKIAAMAADEIIAERQRYRLNRKSILRLVAVSRC